MIERVIALVAFIWIVGATVAFVLMVSLLRGLSKELDELSSRVNSQREGLGACSRRLDAHWSRIDSLEERIASQHDRLLEIEHRSRL
jgi:beta-lactamase regulating signal transducer with metallopeptidase domain